MACGRAKNDRAFDVPNYNRSVTKALRQLALEAHTVDEEGVTLTRAESMAKLLWEKALGSKKIKKDKQGHLVEVENPAEAWAIGVVYDRLEGKVAPVEPEPEMQGRATATEKVEALARDRVNGLLGPRPTGDKYQPPTPAPVAPAPAVEQPPVVPQPGEDE